MNISKNMEIIFVVTLALASSALYVDQLAPTAQAHALPSTLSAGAAPSVPVISVVGKRMTAQEKARSLQEELRQASRAADGKQI